MTLTVIAYLCLLAIGFVAFCGGLAGALVGFWMRPIIFATGPMRMDSDDSEEATEPPADMLAAMRRKA